ncbi:MAG: hypothetical protein EOO46_08965 [Flavobacterium sp.]|nr:MAG: hypothetical protein EOO46_08965 [Flavobacterium sp.]
MKFKLLFVALFYSCFCFSQSDSISVKSSREKKFSLTVDYGFGFRTAKVPNGTDPQVKNYIKDLKSGNSLNFKVGYLKDSNTMLGLMYSRYNSKGSLNNIAYVEPNGIEGQGTISDDITISFYGIGGAFHFSGFREQDAVVFDMYLGYINYKNDTNLTNNYTIKGGNLGLSTSLGYYIALSPSIKIGPSIAFNGGVLKKFNIEGDNGYSGTYKLDKDEVESLYRFDLMIGTMIQL